MAQGFVAPETDRVATPQGGGQGGPRFREVIPAQPGAGKTTYGLLTPEEVKAAGLPPGVYQRSSENKIEKVTDAAVSPDDSDRVTQINTILENLGRARELARKPFAVGNLAGNPYFQGIPILGQNAADVQGALEMAQGDLIQQARKELLDQGINIGVRGADTEKEAARLAASKANLSQYQSYDEFLIGLDRAEQYYKRALVREMGLDPNDPAVAAKYGIGTAGKEATAADKAASRGSASGEQTDRSAPPPIVGQQLSAAVSTDEKTTIDPFLQKHGTRLAQMLAADPSEVSNAMILGWIKKNGGDPSSLGNLNVNLKFRVSSDRKRIPRWTPSVDPRVNVPLDETETGFLGSEKDQAERSASPTGAATLGAADAGTLGALPDAMSLITGTPREETVQALQVSADEHPGMTLAGNFLGGLSTIPFLKAPSTFGGMMKQGAGIGGVYGGLSSEDPSIGGRFENALGGTAVGLAAPPILDPLLRAPGAAFRAGKRVMGRSDPDARAIDTIAPRSQFQDIEGMKREVARQRELGVEPNMLSATDRRGQDFIAGTVGKSPEARSAADEALASAQARMPKDIADDFSRAIDDVAGGEENVAAFLKRPAREITDDIQAMAGREYEAGIAPIKNERVLVDNELAEMLDHEQVRSAISDALRGQDLSTETRAVLRSLPQWLKEGSDLKNLPTTVDALRNIGTALDRRAMKLQEGSEGGMVLSDIARLIRDKIGEQFPEYAPVNALYASRMRARDALNDTRKAFLGDATGEKTDDLAKATARMRDTPGEPEYRGPAASARAGEVVEPPAPGELWSLPEEELQSLAAEKGLSDKQKLVRAFGSEERARRFESLDRTANSSMDPRRADEASRMMEREFGNLTPEQERLVYGIGETDAQASDIRELLQAYSDVIPGDDAGWSSYMAAHAARRVRPEELAKVPLGQGSVAAQAAYIRMGRAYQNLAAQGVPASEIPSRMTRALVERGGWTPAQASEVIGSFADDMAKMGRSPRPLGASRPRPAANLGYRADGPNLPSEKQMAVAGAREATVASAKSRKASGGAVADELSGPGQQERNRMVLPDETASTLEARSAQRAANLDAQQRVKAGGRGDESEHRTSKMIQSVADFGRGWPLAGIAAAISGVRGVRPEEAARIIKLYSEQGKADQILAQLEKRYGERKARFILNRAASVATVANQRRSKPPE